ncbi:hypothetical protein [Brucella sp. IR073]|uniref:hypothetical protein n=1 Tax=unclassified Brucella TaxID=2632610 RepID=UPI003B9869A8
MIDFYFHDVESIELERSFVENSNCRRVRVRTKDGQNAIFTFYGKTDALEALPKAEDFVALKPRIVA